jgi:hypothetical protein
MRIFVVTAILAFAPIAVAVQNQPSGPQDRKTTQQTTPAAPVAVNCNCTAQTDNSKNKPRGWHKLITWPEGVATWALILTLGAIVWQAVEVRRSVNVAIGTLNHTRESSERQLRAYVLTELGNIVNVATPLRNSGSYTPTEARVTHPDWGPVAGMHIKNTGQTPAFKVVHWGNILFREFPLKSDLPGPDENLTKSASAIGPGIINTKRLVLAKALTEEEISQLRNSTGAIYVYGFISYEDAFGKKHLTRYRLFHNQGSGAVGISTDLTFAEGGNEAD